MHVAMIGVGALGQIYGVRLATLGACSVTFVIKPGRRPAPLRITRIEADGSSIDLKRPAVDTRVPDAADVVVVCVRAEQLDAALDGLLAAGPRVPVVMLTPMLPPDLERLAHVHGARIRAGMPGVAGYLTRDGSCRYWMPRVAPTLIDAAPPVPAAVEDLAGALRAAGFGVRLENDVHKTNPATTISFIPLAMGMDAAGGIAPLLADRPLLRITLDAVVEGKALAAQVGHTPTWIDLLARFAGPISLRLGVGLARSRAPEVLSYVEEHFGMKLHAQNLAMARVIVAMAREKGTRADALQRLLGRLEAGG
jgi:2-dehydropantoate 2-reductase